MATCTEMENYTREPIEVFDHDWATLATGVAIPHGLYDETHNVGISRLAPVTIPASLPVDSSTGGTPMAKVSIRWLTRFAAM